MDTSGVVVPTPHQTWVVVLWQISCMGLLLEIFSRNGSVSKVILAWCSFLRKAHANRSTYWRFPWRRDTWHWCHQCCWRLAGAWTRQFDWRVEGRGLFAQTTCSRKRCRRDNLFSVESASPTGDLRCNWE